MLRTISVFKFNKNYSLNGTLFLNITNFLEGEKQTLTVYLKSTGESIGIQGFYIYIEINQSIS